MADKLHINIRQIAPIDTAPRTCVCCEKVKAPWSFFDNDKHLPVCIECMSKVRRGLVQGVHLFPGAYSDNRALTRMAAVVQRLEVEHGR